MDKLDYTKKKNCSSKDTIERMKSQRLGENLCQKIGYKLYPE